MHDLKERLEALADEGTPRGAAVVMQQARRALDDVPPLGNALVPPRTSRRPVVLAFAFVLVVVLVVSSVLVLGGDDQKSRLVPVVPTPNGLTDLFDTSGVPGRPQYLIPGFIPDGMQPLRITDSYQPGAPVAPGSGRSQLWVRLDVSGQRPVEWFMVMWGPGATAYAELNRLMPGLDMPPTDDPLEGSRNGTRVEVRGHEGFYSPRNRSLVWEEPKGQMVSVYGDALPREDLLDLATALRPRRDGGFTVTRTLPGFVQVSEDDRSGSDGSNVREVFYRDAAARGFWVRVVDDPKSPPGANLSSGGDPEMDPRVIELRGRHAVLAKTLTSGGGGLDQQTLFLRKADRHVQWLEPGNVMVTITSVGLSEAELLDVARGLRAVDANEWEQLLVQAPGRSPVERVTPTGEPPTFTGEEAAVAEAFHAWLDARNARDPDAAAAAIEDGDRLRGTFAAAQAGTASLGTLSSRVDSVRLVGSDRALVTFSILANGASKLPDETGAAVKIDGRWVVSRATYCGIVAILAVQCPAP